MTLIDSVQLFHGEVTPASARVYARLDGIEDRANLSLRGWVDGPFRDDAHTLPAKVKLKPCRPGDSLLSEAVLPDPCVWSPDSPATYRAEIALFRDTEMIGRQQRELGLRGLGTFRESIFRLGKRWVLRGVELAANADIDWANWQAQAAVMVVRRIDEPLCAEATRRGVPLVVRVHSGDADSVNLASQLAQWPAVALVWFDGDDGDAKQFRNDCPDVLVGRRCPGATAESVPSVFDVLLCDEKLLELRGSPSNKQNTPVIAVRTLDADLDLERARAECDDLQRHLARTGDFAGYFVMGKEE